MARLSIDLKESTKAKIVKQAKKLKLTIKTCVLNALGLKDE